MDPLSLLQAIGVVRAMVQPLALYRLRLGYAGSGTARPRLSTQASGSKDRQVMPYGSTFLRGAVAERSGCCFEAAATLALHRA
jgi:hypothetical protein